MKDPADSNLKLIVFGIAGLIVLAMFSMAIGKYFVSPSHILSILFSGITGDTSGIDPIQSTVIWNVRLPRVAAGLLIAIDVLPKVLVLLLLAVGAVLVAVDGRVSRRTS